MTDERKTIPVKRSQDAQVEEMIADPDAYFRKVRARARDEAEVYVARRRMAGKPYQPRRKRKASTYLRFPFSDGAEVVLTASTPLTDAEFDYLIAAILDLRPAFVPGQVGSPAPEGNAASESLRADSEVTP
jgi:hypothetical protein